MTEVRKKRAFVPVTVREYLDWEKVSRIEVNAPDLPGISIDVGQTRDYPFGKQMAHVLGYVAAVSESELKDAEDPLLELPGFKVGKNGLEKAYDEKLRGTAGTSTIEVNAVGRTIRELKREEGTPGKDLVLSVDSRLQTYVQQRLSAEKSASVVLMDIASGGVLAMGSVPSFDPNAFNLGISSAHWRKLLNDPLHPLTNKATAGLYNPGSTYKMVVALAALEAGIDPAQEVYCPGHYKLGNARFHCWKRYGHGKMDMHAAIKESCDVYFYDVSRKVGVDKIAEMSHRLGLGDETGLDLPGERGGTIPTKAWKRAQIGEPWQGGETLVTAIGQGFVLTSPLQLAVMTARIAGGHAVTPHFARDLQPRADDSPKAQAVDAAQAVAEGARRGPASQAPPTAPRAAAMFPKLDISDNAPRSDPRGHGRGGERAGRHRLRQADHPRRLGDGRQDRHLAGPPDHHGRTPGRRDRERRSAVAPARSRPLRRLRSRCTRRATPSQWWSSMAAAAARRPRRLAATS